MEKTLALHAFRSIVSFFHSIKWKLFISYVCLSIIPTAIISVILYIYSYRAIENKIANYSQQIIVQTVGKLDGKLENAQDLSLQIVTQKDFQQRLQHLWTHPDAKSADDEAKAVEKELDTIISSRSDVVGAEVLMANSDRVMVAGEYLADPKVYKQDPAYLRSMTLPGAYAWKGAVYNRNPQVLYPHIATLTRKIKSVATGEDLGALVIGIKEFAIADTYSYLDLGPTGFVFVIDEDGTVISHLDKNKLNKKSDYPLISKIIDAPVDQSRTFPSYLDGKKVLVSYGVSELAGWIMVSVIPYDYLTEEINSIKIISVRIGIILLLASVIISFYISSTISRPVEALVRAMRKVENGDLNVSVSLKARNEIGSLGHHFNHMVKRMNVLIKRVYESELVKKEAEVKALQSQINPHFLYNTLAIIDSMASIKKEKEISEITQILADIFRYSISGNDVTTIKEEINQVQRYLYIQKIRYKNKITETIEIDPETENCLITKLLLQPIVENAIIHGISRTSDHGRLSIKVFSVDEDTLTIEISDNGNGIPEQRLQEIKTRLREADSDLLSTTQRGGHIGIENVHRRIRNTFGDEYGLEIESRPGQGTKVIMVIPKLT
ncbi:MAG: Histidine kinase [Cohnella sp.]|nr:Histidine kinase [Cohnella sp.]